MEQTLKSPTAVSPAAADYRLVFVIGLAVMVLLGSMFVERGRLWYDIGGDLVMLLFLIGLRTWRKERLKSIPSRGFTFKGITLLFITVIVTFLCGLTIHFAGPSHHGGAHSIFAYKDAFSTSNNMVQSFIAILAIFALCEGRLSE